MLYKNCPKKIFRNNILFTFFILSASSILHGGNPIPSSMTIEKAEKALKGQAVLFEENKGQMKDMNNKPVAFVLFKASTPSVDFYITKEGFTYVFQKREEIKTEQRAAAKDDNDPFQSLKELPCIIKWARVDMKLKGAQIKKENIITEGKSADASNFYLSNCPDGVMDVHKYEKIIIKNVYAGIDWVIYNSGNAGLKYDFIVQPGADPSQIELVYASENPLQLNKEGNIIINTPYGQLIENAPFSFTKENSKPVASGFVKKILPSKNEVGVSFKIEKYNKKQTLVIDPQLVWSTILGNSEGNSVYFHSLDCDSLGNVFVAGIILKSGGYFFPALDPGGGAYFQGTYASMIDLVILKFSNSGVLIWATYYGGTDNDWAYFLTTDKTGNIIITGFTLSKNLPLFNPGGGAHYQTFGGGTAPDGFVLKFSNKGVRLWATYLGGNFIDYSKSLAIDNNNNILVTGLTYSTNFPLKNPGGTAYFQSTFPNNNSVLFISKFSPTGILLWSTFFGDYEDEGHAIATDKNGNVFVTGYTRSVNFPVKDPGSGAYFQAPSSDIMTNSDAYMLKFSSTGELLWSTFFGGVGSIDQALSLAVDNSGDVFAYGFTAGNFPTLDPGSGAYYQSTYGGGKSDVFIAKFNNGGKLIWSTYYGGSEQDLFVPNNTADDIDLDECGNLYVSIASCSPDLITKNPGCDYFNGTYSGMFIGGGWSPMNNFLKFSNTGVLQWASYFGTGHGAYSIAGITTDINNNFFVGAAWQTDVGPTSTTFPFVNPGNGAYFQDSISTGYGGSGFIAKFEPWLKTQNLTTPTSCLCNGSATIKLNCASPPLDYEWSNGFKQLGSMDTSSTVTGLCSGIYTVTIKDLKCNKMVVKVPVIDTSVHFNLNVIQTGPVPCSIDTLGTLTASASGSTSPYTYTWNNGQTLSTITGLSAGTYTCTATDSKGCSQSVKAKVIINTPPSLVIQGGSSICYGKTTILTASGGDTYSWDTGQSTSAISVTPAVNTTYTVTVGKGGCSATATALVTVNALPNITKKDTTICPGSSTVLNVSGGTSYSWSPATGLNSTTGSNVIASPLTSTTYTVTGSNGICSNTTTVKVIVKSVPAVSITGKTSVCMGQSTTLTANGGTIYIWNTGETTTTISITPAATTTYTVTTSNNGCSAMATKIVAISSGPVLTIGNNVNIKKGDNTTLTISGGVSYTWSPAKGLSCSTCQNPVANPSVTTDYCVTVTDANGCTATTCVTIFVDENLSFPNVYTPNGDGINDLFVIEGLQPGIAPLKIYNRWGAIVYESEAYKNDWDGSNVSDGVYYYILEYPIDHKSYSGFIQVLKTRN